MTNACTRRTWIVSRVVYGRCGGVLRDFHQYADETAEPYASCVFEISSRSFSSGRFLSRGDTMKVKSIFTSMVLAGTMLATASVFAQGGGAGGSAGGSSGGSAGGSSGSSMGS